MRAPRTLTLPWLPTAPEECLRQVRVHDARNNLEVANRAQERARKELRDAEGLVLAARQEHQTYENQRTDFIEFKQRYDSRMQAAQDKAAAVQLYERRAEKSDTQLRAGEARFEELQGEARSLKAEQRSARELVSRDRIELAEPRASVLAPKHAREQELVQILRQPAPVLSKVAHGIVVPDDSARHDRAAAARGADASPAAALARLQHRAAALGREEVAAFARLPGDQEKVRALDEAVKGERAKAGLDESRMLITSENLRHVERHGGSPRAVKLAGDKARLARVDARIAHRTISHDRKEVAALRADEQQGPRLSRELSHVQARIRTMRRAAAKQASLAAAEGVALQVPAPAREQSLAMTSAQRKHAARRMGGAGAAPVSAVQAVPAVRTESRAVLKGEVQASRRKLHALRAQLLAVQSRLKSQEEEVGVRREQLRDRVHSVHHSTQVLESADGQPTQALFNAYDEKLSALKEERRKADGLLAKAERMLNIARTDSLHASRTKKAALEELKYATSKLRRYQDLRSSSQSCQMDAWSEIRTLTHSARERKLLEAADERKVEALKQVLGDARTMDLAQV